MTTPLSAVDTPVVEPLEGERSPASSQRRGGPDAYVVRRCLLAVSPDASERKKLTTAFGIPAEFVEHSLDAGERPRTEKKNEAVLVVLRVPIEEPEGAAVPFSTIPLGLILTGDTACAVCGRDNAVASSLRELGESLGAPLPTHIVILRALKSTADAYLVQLQAINDAVDELEGRLRASLGNREVLEILRYQKSLVYFTTALQSIEQLVKRLQASPTFHVPAEDETALEDVLIEIRQAVEVATISRDILSQMMDAFASIISNNLNIVMKFLAAFTVVLTLPVLIASLYGMNVRLPFQHGEHAFVVISAIAVLFGAMTFVVFRHKRWL